MTPIIHLTIQNGAEAGRGITVPPTGMRVGRGDKNDLVVDDTSMSRHHCRFSFRDGNLFVTDLGSANRCLVNGNGIDEAQLTVGDVVTVGGTEFHVDCATLETQTVVPNQGNVDLGFASVPAPKPESPRRQLMGWVVVAIVAVTALIIGVVAQKWNKRADSPAQVSKAAMLMPLEVVYEKVNASSSNIVYYRMVIGADGSVSVQMDDLVSKRHVLPDRKLVASATLETLSQRLIDSGFFSLDTEYRGIRSEEDVLLDLSITAGRRTHRSRVINRAAPDVFARAGAILEEFTKNELGLWATDVSPEKLIEMADAAFRLGKRLYDERQIKHDNLARALKSYEEAEWCLQTVDPKPDFHAEVVTGIETLKTELQAQYEEQSFRVERAMRLREWDTAQRELQLICESIPDTADSRNVEARAKLLDVEKKLREKK